ncbi:nitrate ABC transporter substrate-binding protein [Corynebacterium sp. AOP40-9SA-29]|uniref:nitrate ABC transporter substrate-binding protein n=1 Tax=Corynebacterium sp. AOP40-9SA-29 TaxID=3457677 RepID=UPI004033C5D8
MRTARTIAAALGAAALTGGLVACGSDDTGGADITIEPAAEEYRLDDVCPENIDVQLQWQPQSDQAGIIGLLGADYSIDAASKSATGSLVFDDGDTGVDLTLRAGGASIGFQSVPDQMYTDTSIDLGLVHQDQMVAAADTQRVIGLTPLLKTNPSILMWDPETHPDWDGVEDIRDSGETVVVSADQVFPRWLVAEGLLDEDQIDTSYDGAPARFVSDPSIAQQGFANSEPYRYEHEVESWMKPVDYQLVRDMTGGDSAGNTGYDTYGANLTVRPDRLDDMSDCLEKLVPMVQQTGADYVADPEATNQLIIDWVSSDNAYNPYTAEQAAASAEVLRDEDIIAPGDDGVWGSYDMDKAADSTAMLVDVLNSSGSSLPEDIAATDLFDPRFISTDITESS